MIKPIYATELHLEHQNHCKMFRSKRKSKSKAYQLRSNNQSIKIPLTFHGKSVELNSQVLGKGKYTLYTDDQEQNSSIPLMLM